VHGNLKVLVMDGPSVAWNYLRNPRFLLDAVSVVPFFYLVTHPVGNDAASSLNLLLLVQHASGILGRFQALLVTICCLVPCVQLSVLTRNEERGNNTSHDSVVNLVSLIRLVRLLRMLSISRVSMSLQSPGDHTVVP
jgi:hypothetical protein